jgi:hypothetical protein
MGRRGGVVRLCARNQSGIQQRGAESVRAARYGPRIQEQHVPAGILGQTRREHRTGGSGTDHDDIRSAAHESRAAAMRKGRRICSMSTQSCGPRWRNASPRDRRETKSAAAPAPASVGISLVGPVGERGVHTRRAAVREIAAARHLPFGTPCQYSRRCLNDGVGEASHPERARLSCPQFAPRTRTVSHAGSAITSFRTPRSRTARTTSALRGRTA